MSTVKGRFIIFILTVAHTWQQSDDHREPEPMRTSEDAGRA